MGFIVYIVPMCCLNGTSNKEHTFKVMGGVSLFAGVRQTCILRGSRVGNVPCLGDIDCIEKYRRGGVGVIHLDFGHLHNVGTNFLQNYGFRATKETSILFIKYKNFTTNGGGKFNY